MKSISHKLQFHLSSARNRSRSIGEGDSGHTSATPGKSSSAASQTNLATNVKRGISVSREVSPLASPAIGTTTPRRFSAFGARPEVPSPRRSSVQLAASAMQAPEIANRSVSSQSAQKGFVVHRPQTHLPGPQPDTFVALSDGSAKRPGPRTAASTGSLDQLRGIDTSPVAALQRRPSSGSDSSSRLGHRLIKILSFNGGRSRSRTNIAHDADDRSTTDAARSVEATSIAESRPSIDSVSTGHPRRGSALSEDPFQPPVTEEVDWDPDISDEDDYADLAPSHVSGVSVPPRLDPLPDTSPIMIASPPRHGSPRGHERLSHRHASPASTWSYQGRARSPLGLPIDGQPGFEPPADSGLSYVSKRSRKGSVLSSRSDR
jgi:hypothetical protein